MGQFSSHKDLSHWLVDVPLLTISIMTFPHTEETCTGFPAGCQGVSLKKAKVRTGLENQQARQTEIFQTQGHRIVAFC